MSVKHKIIIIHGNGGGTGTDNWYPYVKAELEKLGHEVIAENFPDPVEAKASIWLPYIHDVLKADENTIIIGHSSGAVAAMRYAENNKLYGSVLVGTCHTDLGWESEKISGYYDAPWQWEDIIKNQKWIIQFASTDDPYIGIEEARHVHEKLQTEYYEYTDHGHFGSGKQEMTTFPELVEALKKKLLI